MTHHHSTEPVFRRNKLGSECVVPHLIESSTMLGNRLKITSRLITVSENRTLMNTDFKYIMQAVRRLLL